jgi:hypothetical protein
LGICKKKENEEIIVPSYSRNRGEEIVETNSSTGAGVAVL